MATTDKAIITCALTGVLTNPKQHPVPVTPAEMAAEAKRAADAGAAIVGLTRAGVDVALEVFVDDIGLSPGTSLIDHMGGPASSVSLTGKVALTIPAGGAVILAPE